MGGGKYDGKGRDSRTAQRGEGSMKGGVGNGDKTPPNSNILLTAGFYIKPGGSI